MKGSIVFKMSGSGNDFVFVDGRTSPLTAWTAERIRAVCARGTGIGADGVVVLEPGTAPGRVRFHFFNNDGSRADMCGNAALCATRLAAWLELAPVQEMVLETDAGDVETRCLAGEGERAEILLPPVGDITSPEITLAPGELSIHLTRVGVPHLVVRVGNLAAVPLAKRGSALRSDPKAGPAGANVNFVAVAGSQWAMRTFERGVEAETLACGSGAAACAAVLAQNGGVEFPWDVRSASGAILTVTPASDGRPLRRARLAGEGRLVFRAILDA